MRPLAFLSLALLTSGCWTPGPGQRDPTRYPWDPRNMTPAAHPRIEARGAIPPLEHAAPGRPQPVSGNYCIMSLEPGSASGITVGGADANGVQLACDAQPQPRPRD